MIPAVDRPSDHDLPVEGHYQSVTIPTDLVLTAAADHCLCAAYRDEYGGKVSAGVHGAICIWYHDHRSRMRLATCYVGEGGIKADTMYRCDGDGNFVEV